MQRAQAHLNYQPAEMEAAKKRYKEKSAFACRLPRPTCALMCRGYRHVMSCTCRLRLTTFGCETPGLTPDNRLGISRVSCLLCRNSRRQAPILVDLHGLHVSEAIVEIIKMRKWIAAAPLDSALFHSSAVRATCNAVCPPRGRHIVKNTSNCLDMQSRLVT